ncbi:MAG: hypothetical protein ABSD31_11595 [Candidatus Binataceae bacterium]|jgi:hypothetical protein
MRRARRGLTPDSAAPAHDALARLETHRDFHFRRVPNRRVAGEKSALRFINDVGFCTAFTPGLGLPCLREAIAGEREPPLPEHIQHDYAIGMTWRLKDVLPAAKSVYYGKALGGRPSFIALELFPAFLRLRLEPGGYGAMYRRGALSHCAKLVMDALSRRGASETRALKLASGRAAAAKRSEFDNAMKELQEKFLALKVEERYDPFTYVWDTLENRWGEAIREARDLTQSEAAYRIMRRYLEVSAFGNERAMARMLGIAPRWIEGAARRLARENRLVRTRLPNLGGEYCVLSTFVAL